MNLHHIIESQLRFGERTLKTLTKTEDLQLTLKKLPIEYVKEWEAKNGLVGTWDPVEHASLKAQGEESYKWSKEIIASYSKWTWFDIGEFQSITESMSLEDAFKTTDAERLPFPNTAITFSYKKSEDNTEKSICLWCEQIAEDGSFEVTLCMSLKDGEWGMLSNKILITKLNAKWKVGLGAGSAFGQEGADELLGCVFIMLKVLRCNNVYVDREVFPKKLNKSRLKKGKILGYVKHVLKIQGHAGTVGISESSGTHASPKIHFRRGHVRKLSSGVLTWVRECLVGRQGVFKDKEYKVMI